MVGRCAACSTRGMKRVLIFALANLGLTAPLAPVAAAVTRPDVRPLPAEYRAIALKVAGAGLPDCRSFHPDGSEGPCLPRFTVKPGGGVNGWSLDGHIAFSEGATRKLTPDEFALLAGHEIAHWYLGHKGGSAPDELAADRLGAALACAAGYDVAQGAGLFRHLRTSRVHAGAKVRLAMVQKVRCERGYKPFDSGMTNIEVRRIAHPMAQSVQKAEHW